MTHRYPVRDPFFKMLPRSLSNFMNAFTSSDHTTYPFATTNAQDFRNLMSVYLDATLNPLLKPTDFTQEGWRIGPENPLAKDDRLVFKGVVYNEMKGQMSDASYLYYIRFHEHLIPALNNSGGDPAFITDLTYDQLKSFHGAHYHPSNAKIFTYGDQPFADHLQYVDSQLRNFSRIAIDEDVKTPIDLSAGTKEVTVKGPLDPLVPADKQWKTSVTWVVPKTEDLVERFGLSVLSSLLLDGYGSPFYTALIESGLGSDFTPNTGFSATGRGATFSVGLTGVSEDAVKQVKDTIHSTLKDIHTKGFEPIKVEGILHQLELSLKHKTAHFGMGLMSRVHPDWFNGVDPFDALAWQSTVDGFKQKYAQGGYLESLLGKYYDSPNTLTFTMAPSETYAQETAKEETARLAKKIEEASEGFESKEVAREHLVKRELELLEEQENGRNQDLSSLPTLHVKDIPRVKPKKELRHSSIGDVKVQWREVETNGLTYFRAVHSFANLPDELRELIPLFTESLLRLGTKNMSMEKIEELIKLKTGGVNIGYHSSTSPTSFKAFEEGLVFSGYAFDRNVPALYDILRTLLLETDFDSPDAEGRVRQLLQASANGAMDAVAEQGHAYARRFAMAGLTPEGRVREQISGLSQVKLTTSLAARAAEPGALADVLGKLKLLQSIAISNASSLRIALNCGPDSSLTNERLLTRFLSSLPSKINTPLPTNLTAPTSFARDAKTFFPLPYQVYYSGLARATVPYTHASSPALQVLAQLLTHKHLHHEIREKGGAYGGGAFANPLGGTLGFYSYRDPNPQNTLSIVGDVGRWAAQREWTDRDIEEAKLSVFQGLDAPVSVSEEGMSQFLAGVEYETQQERRERLLDITAQDVKSVAEEFLENGEGLATTVLGARQPWVKDNEWQVKDLGVLGEQIAEQVGEEAQAIAAAAA
jgi:Zn-dependent M16 (insulinase) family peptidase